MAMHTLGPPLSARDLGEINKSIFLLNQLLERIDQAERAGIDVAEIRDRRDQLYQQATMMKAAYFPGDE